jgi:feruloyl esterase
LLEQEILAQCDQTDGQVDGFISTPRRCTVDLSLLPACKANGLKECFTAEELAVLSKWYRGPQDSSGKQLFPGMPAGSERYWALWFLDNDSAVAPGNALGGDYARYLGFEETPPHGYSALDFDFDRDPERLQSKGRLFDALEPDLETFRAAGGKYLMWHGWQDPLVLPDRSIEYHDSVVAEMGGRKVVDSFYRLFMIPGMGHCWELPSVAPDQFDPLAVLEEWVENEQAPSPLLVIAADPKSAAVDAMAVCPYPAATVYLPELDQLSENDCPAGPD